ncbi:MAG: GIY-YIG nuclease family protein [Eudoraea sp.]|nr:GIY-YIG nuclease family protein [Eudoraea sp.]
MCYYVYIISSEKLGRFYVGQTKNISKRIFDHNHGMSNYTSAGIPWELECVIEKSNLKEALILEKKLKNLSRARKIRFIERYGLKYK